VAVPIVAAPSTAPPAEAAAASSEDHRNANELARQAIERLRANGDVASRVQEAPREVSRETTRAAPAVALAPVVRPLPPPVILAAPPAESSNASAANPPYTASVPVDDPNRPIPPAEIPPPRPRLPGAARRSAIAA